MILGTQAAVNSTALWGVRRPGTALVLRVLSIAVAYFALAKLGLGLASLHPSVSPIWPAAGFAIAAVLLWGPQTLPAIFVGALAANATTAGSLVSSMAIASGNTLEAFAAGYFVNRWSSGTATFDTPLGVAKFALFCFVPSTFLAAGIGAGVLGITGLAAPADLSSIWLTWWLGDFAGALVVAPAIILWTEGASSLRQREHRLETAAVFMVAVLAGLLAFSPVMDQTANRGPVAFFAIIPLMWAALRLGQRETATTALIVSCFAIWGTLAGGGPFARPTLNESFLTLVAFVISTVAPSLALSADVTVRKLAEAGMRETASQRDREIAAHKFVQEALRKSESRLQRAQEAGGVSNWEWSPKLKKLWWSEGMYRLVGRELGNFAGIERRALEIVHPEDRERLRNRFREILAGTGERFDTEFRTLWPDGTIRWLLGRADVERDEHGHAARVVGICLDVTDRHRIEEALQQRERHLSVILNEVPAGIVQTDTEGHYVLINDWFCRFVGRPRQDIIGRRFSDLIHPDDVPESERMRSRARETGEPYTVRRRYLRLDGSTAHAQAHVTLLSERGQSRSVLAVITDLTERLESEERQKLLLNELNHRVKNTLASVQSLAVMSMRHADSMQSFTDAFLSRIHALSTTHDLLTESEWRSASLRDVIKVELQPYDTIEGGRIKVSGPPVALTPSQVINFGLLFHELATNAAKHGSLSSPSGRIEVNWTIENREGGQRLTVNWHEEGGPTVSPPTKPGFGSHLIERTIRQGLGGAMEVSYEAAGFRCAIRSSLL